MESIQQDIMAVLPNEGQGKALSTPQIRDALIRMGSAPSHVKTVQRKLEMLEDYGYVVGQREGRALYWQRRKGVHGLSNGKNAALSFDDALALQVLSRFAAHMLPAFVVHSLKPMFDAASSRLNSAQNEAERAYVKWEHKVAVSESTFQLQLPVVKPEILAVITRALFQERCIQLRYQSRANPETESRHEICPLGIVDVGGIVYLVAGRLDRPYQTMYRLNRIIDVSISAIPFDYPVDFNLNAYVKEQRQFDFFTEGEIAVVLRFSKKVGEHLLESPISPDQTYKIQDAYIDIRGTAVLSKRLRWWIKSFGSEVEVLEPLFLRKEFEKESRALAAMYDTSALSL